MEEMENSFAKGIKLTENEKEEITIEEEDEEELIEDEIPRSLIGTLLTDKNFRSDFLKSTMINAWRLKGKVEVKDISKNLYLFTFENLSDKDSVVQKGPWNYENTILMLENLNKDINPKNMVFKEVQFWVQIHNLPLRAMRKTVVSKIGKSLGKLIMVDENEQGLKWGAFTRVRVGIDIRKPLQRGATINIPELGKIWVVFKYERLRKLCQWCGMIGHAEAMCSLRREDGRGEYEDMGAEKEILRTKVFEGNNQQGQSSFSNSNRTGFEKDSSKGGSGRSDSDWRLESGNNSRIMKSNTIELLNTLQISGNEKERVVEKR